MARLKNILDCPICGEEVTLYRRGWENDITRLLNGEMSQIKCNHASEKKENIGCGQLMCITADMLRSYYKSKKPIVYKYKW